VCVCVWGGEVRRHTWVNMAAAAATSDDDVQMMQKIHHSVLIVHRQTPVFDIRN